MANRPVNQASSWAHSTTRTKGLGILNAQGNFCKYSGANEPNALEALYQRWLFSYFPLSASHLPTLRLNRSLSSYQLSWQHRCSIAAQPCLFPPSTACWSPTAQVLGNKSRLHWNVGLSSSFIWYALWVLSLATIQSDKRQGMGFRLITVQPATRRRLPKFCYHLPFIVATWFVCLSDFYCLKQCSLCIYVHFIYSVNGVLLQTNFPWAKWSISNSDSLVEHVTYMSFRVRLTYGFCSGLYQRNGCRPLSIGWVRGSMRGM